jgi:hypothetical protein
LNGDRGRRGTCEPRESAAVNRNRRATDEGVKTLHALLRLALRAEESGEKLS